MRFHSKVLLLLSVLAVVSCGNKSSSSKAQKPQLQTDNRQNEEIKVDGSNINGIYATDLYPVNANLQLKTVGAAALERDGDSFKAYVKFNFGSRATAYRQAIYTGRRCPTLDDDLNHDAYIDIQEFKLAMGKVTIPLDSDLDSQVAGMTDFPVGDAKGKYSYNETTSFSKMFADLKDPTATPADGMIKLGENDGLTLPGRIVVIHGLSELTFLPDTVASTPGESKYATIPVACGTLWKVDKLPDDLN